MKEIEKEILLSFVLPIYNVEAYLQECIDSILDKITDECEIVLVNDGSTDSSGDICLRYSEEYPMIRVVQKENGGLSSARNAGIAVAKGKYISFIDSDDKIFPDSVAEILAWIKTGGTDMCFLQAVKFYPDGTQNDLGEGIARSALKSQSRNDAIKHLSTRSKYPGSAWAKLYRRKFLVDNDLHFPYDRRYSEDLGFIRDCILCANDFDALEIPYYQYRQNRSGSITNKITSKNFYDLLRFVDESAEKLTVNKKAVDYVSELVMGFVAYEYTILLYLYNFIPIDEKKEALLKLKEFKWTLKYAGSKKTRLVSCFCSLFGVKIASSAMKQYRKAVEK